MPRTRQFGRLVSVKEAPESRTKTIRIQEKISSFSLFIFLGFIAADLILLSYRSSMLPNQAPPSKPPKQLTDSSLGRGAFNSIISRNIFSPTGEIPDPLVAKDGAKKEEIPVPSSLPLNLMGTLVHSNPAKSLASIEIKGKGQAVSYAPKQEIENLATIEKVERMKVFIRNFNTGKLEFIEMKNTAKTLRGSVGVGLGSAVSNEVKKNSDNEFEMKRSDLQKYLADISSVLMLARAMPARRSGSGEIYGYRLLDIQAGSIFSQLGLQVQDVITGVNGSPVTSPDEAMAQFQALKSSDHIELGIERGGVNQKIKYKVSN